MTKTAAESATNPVSSVISRGTSKGAGKVTGALAGAVPFRGFWQRWLARRIPAQRSVLLNHRCIFIFPSKAGFGFLLLTALLWLAATNYENNLIFALTFLLVGLFIISILHTYSNLSGLRVTLVRSQSACVGEDLEFSLLIQREQARDYENILLGWPGVAPVIANLIEHDQEQVKLFLPAPHRGWVRPGRVKLETYYPLGLLRAWSWLDLDASVLAYPKPIDAGPLPLAGGGIEAGETELQPGNDEFQGLRDYQLGEPLNRVAWKHYAREQGMQTKQYASSLDRRLWVDWEYLPGLALEARLSGLCHWVQVLANGHQEYGLRLPGLEIAPGRGEAHRDRLLRELALFEAPSVTPVDR